MTCRVLGILPSREIPAGVTVSVNGREISVKGAKDELLLTMAQPLEVLVEENQVLVTPGIQSMRKVLFIIHDP